MRTPSIFNLALLLAALLLLAVLGFAFTGNIASAGPLAIAFFLSLALACRGYAAFRGLSYTVIIFAAVTTALYYPQYFQTWGGFKLSTLITPLIQVIMFGMGTSMGLKDFAGVIKTPKGVFIGVTSHFIIMPLIGFTLARLSHLPPEIAAGIILIGCSPNGLASNVISYLAKANLALSITITAVSTLLAPFVTPFLMKWLAGAFVSINAMSMMGDIIKMVIVPIGGGIIFNKLFGGSSNAHGAPAPASAPRRATRFLDKAMPIVSMSGIACIIVIITAAGRDSLLTIGPLLVFFVLLHNLSGYTLGYWTGRLFRMDERDCRTMAIEVGMQNGGLASGLAKEMGKLATVGLAPAIFGPLMNVTGSILASYWHRKPPKTPPATLYSSSAIAPVLLFLMATSLLLSGCRHREPASMDTGANYPAYGGTPANNRYSPLDQINLQNVRSLHVAWTYDAREPTDSASPGPHRPKEIQCQPIVINGILYATTGTLNLFALNAATGQRLWQFEPRKENQKFNTSRGLIYWENGDDHRIFYSAGSTLYAVNATTGKAVPTFGDNGGINLHEGLGAGLHHDVSQLSVTASTPGVICRNVLVIGSSVSEGGDAAPGHVRGFDVITGKLLWTFHTIPQPGEPGYDTWPEGAYERFGGANAWGGVAADEKKGMVYFGTGSPSSDFYGGDRQGANLFGNCVVALDAKTGKLKWHFQTIHHDLWDCDIPCPPGLVTVKHNGRSVDALVAVTKDGMIYVLDRDSGTSLFPIVERPVPSAGLPGEHPWPTQKFPLKPYPLSRQTLTEADLTNLSPQAHAAARAYFRQSRSPRAYSRTSPTPGSAAAPGPSASHPPAAGPSASNAATPGPSASTPSMSGPPDSLSNLIAGKFLPPDTAATFLFGYSGGAEWGGNATDPSGILYQNANDDPWELRMVDRAEREKAIASLTPGNALYIKACSFCHGMDRKGSGHEFPELLTVNKRRNASSISDIIKTGSGRMPSFSYLAESDRNAIVAFLLGKEARRTARNPAVATSSRTSIPSQSSQVESEHSSITDTAHDAANSFPYLPKYVNKVWRRWTDANGYNAVTPPWGTLNAIDLNTGNYLWRVPLGEYPELTKNGVPPTGTENYGGPLVTAGGLLFIAATRDEKIRAFDTRTGASVWEYQLPAGGFATPITYEADGKQYVVIAAGGGRGGKPGGWYVAFSL